MNDFFTELYTFFHGYQDPTFRMEIYDPLGMIMVFTSIVVVLLFYYGLNSWTAKYSGKLPWILFMLINSVLSFAIAIAICNANEMILGFTPILTLAIINFIFAAIFYGIFSVISKWWSPNAKKTPF